MLKNFLYFFLFIITTAWSTTKTFTLIIAAAELRDQEAKPGAKRREFRDVMCSVRCV